MGDNSTVEFKTLGFMALRYRFIGEEFCENQLTLELSKSTPFTLKKNVEICTGTNFFKKTIKVKYWLFWEKDEEVDDYNLTYAQADTLQFNDCVYVIKIYEKSEE